MIGPPPPPPGWYDDGTGQRRWFDGTDWTEHLEQPLAIQQPLALEGVPQAAPAKLKRRLFDSDGNLIVPCSACGAGGAYSPDASETTCKACGAVTTRVKCRRCAKSFAMPPHLRLAVKYRCPGCGRTASRTRWDKAPVRKTTSLPSSLVAIYQSAGLDAQASLSDPERRIVEGAIIGADGINGLVAGGCTIFFERDLAIVLVGDGAHPLIIRYQDVTALQFGGRGALVQTSGGGWIGGGFGIEGMITGLAFATVMNGLTTRQTHSVETIVSLAWRTGSITLHNNRWVPEDMARVMAPTTARIQESHHGFPTA